MVYGCLGGWWGVTGRGGVGCHWGDVGCQELEALTVLVSLLGSSSVRVTDKRCLSCLLKILYRNLEVVSSVIN